MRGIFARSGPPVNHNRRIIPQIPSQSKGFFKFFWFSHRLQEVMEPFSSAFRFPGALFLFSIDFYGKTR